MIQKESYIVSQYQNDSGGDVNLKSSGLFFCIFVFSTVHSK